MSRSITSLLHRILADRNPQGLRVPPNWRNPLSRRYALGERHVFRWEVTNVEPGTRIVTFTRGAQPS